LPAMMGLVVEELHDAEHLRLAHLAADGAAVPGDVSRQVLLSYPLSPFDDGCVERYSTPAQLLEILDQAAALGDRNARRGADAEAGEPDHVGPEDVAEGGVDGLEKGAAVGAPLGIREGGRGAVDAAVELGVVGRHGADISGCDHW